MTNPSGQERKLRVLVQGPDIRRTRHGGVVTFVTMLLNSRLKQQYEMDWGFLEVRGRSPLHALYYCLVDTLQVHRNLKHTRYDIVHAHLSIAPTAFLKLFLYIFEKRLRGFRLIVHFHGGRFASIKRWFPIFRVALTRAEKILLLSKSQSSGFECPQLSGRIEVVPNFVHDPRPNLERRELNRMLFVGAIVKEKGILDLIRAVDAVGSSRKGFQLHICGDGPALKQAEQLVETLDLSDHISFEGFVDAEQKQNLMSRCSVLVLPSWSEGFPFVVLEAMSHGLAIVSTRVGALGEVLNDRVHGRFVDAHNPRRLGQVLDELLSQPQLQREYGDTNRMEFIERYAMDPVGVETFARIYDGVGKGSR